MGLRGNGYIVVASFVCSCVVCTTQETGAVAISPATEIRSTKSLADPLTGQSCLSDSFDGRRSELLLKLDFLGLRRLVGVWTE
jgi:hypothetical protein